MITKFLKPRLDGEGKAIEVYIPSKGRNILPEGENVAVDSYVEARIMCGSLVEGEAKVLITDGEA